MNIKKKIYTAFFLLLTALILTNSESSLKLALNGLNLWFQKMIPTLFPFMILSGIMVRMNLTGDFAALFYPILHPLFSLSKNAVYCIIMGFLCGFPMGAKVIGELYERGGLSKGEATYLLSFCNNIGPIYFMGFALPSIGITGNLLVFLFGMYGLPMLYGLFLRYTVYRKALTDISDKKTLSGTRAANAPSIQKHLLSAENQSLLYHIDDSIMSAINGITSLGGYMILFSLLNLVPQVLLGSKAPILPLLNGLLEITSGINRMGSTFALAVLILLPFGGLSCIAQTYSMIRRTDLSIKTYVVHKLMLSFLTALYYALML